MMFLVTLAVVLSVTFAVLLVRQEMERRRSDIEYQVYQIMTGLVDVYTSGGEIDPSFWPELSGFGIYSTSGKSIYRYGTAPKQLADSSSVSPRGDTILTGSSMTIIRRSGPVPLRRNENPKEARRGMGGMMGQGLGPGLGPGMDRIPLMDPMMRDVQKNRIIFIDINVENFLREGRYVYFAVFALLVVFISIVSLVLMYSRKIAVYRDREQKTTHLVQLGEAARTLAHEIKNPLGIIRVQCATLKRTLGEDRQKNIAVIEEETERLAQLTDRVRDFLHNSDGNPQITEASWFLEQCRLRYDGQIAVNLPPGPEVYVKVDVNRMMQVLDNLIVNAIEAVPVSASPVNAPPCVLSMNVSRKLVSFIVADRGMGVAASDRDRLFELFFTTKTGGSGIGLALARRFMEQAGGTLQYEDRAGGGSIFTATVGCVTGEGRIKEGRSDE